MIGIQKSGIEVGGVPNGEVIGYEELILQSMVVVALAGGQVEQERLAGDRLAEDGWEEMCKRRVGGIGIEGECHEVGDAGGIEDASG